MRAVFPHLPVLINSPHDALARRPRQQARPPPRRKTPQFDVRLKLRLGGHGHDTVEVA